MIFAQMVDDPSAHPEQFPTEEAQEGERQRLFRLIDSRPVGEHHERKVLEAAREEFRKG